MVHCLEIREIVQDGSRIRIIFSQIVACISSYLLLFDLGMAISFPTIAVPDLLNAKEGLSLDDTQTSWFGSLSFLTQPLGALLSGPIIDYFGRKRACFLVNIPHLVGWLLMYFAWNVPSLFLANALLGIGTGVMEAPICSYVGEVSEPAVRGALCLATQFFASFGIFIMFFLGTIVNWRYAALICLIAPLTSMLMVLLTPETPVWLLSKGREKQALTSLCQLRGWTKPDNVKEEFDQLNAYSMKLRQCIICYNSEKDEKICEHESMNRFKRSIIKFKHVMLCKETMRPLMLVILYFLFYTMSGLAPLRPNMVNVCEAFGMAQDGKQIVLVVGVLSLLMAILLIGIIKTAGKRKIAITSMLCTAISCMLLSIYARNHLDPSVFSYDITTFPKEKSVVPLILFYMLTIFSGLALPWVLVGEVFPFRSRGTAQGISAASNYVFLFLGSKTFIDLETSVKLWGTFATYSAFGFLGTIFLYFFLPETEEKTLEEIESFFSGGFKIFANDPVFNSVKKMRNRNKNYKVSDCK